MNRTVMIQLPENIYKYLIEMSAATGQSRETLATEWLISGSHYVSDDPIDRFIGAFDSKGSDWPDEHDRYIGNSLMKTMENGSEA